jgi:hypothetical protein
MARIRHALLSLVLSAPSGSARGERQPAMSAREPCVDSATGARLHDALARHAADSWLEH